jgi:type II secretory pathway pseudopilin PulG
LVLQHSDDFSNEYFRYGGNMQEKNVASIFLEIFVVVAILGTLSAIGLPRVGPMFNRGKVESQESELHNIQTAVTEMLYDSVTGALESVGPTADMSQVRTTDTPSLALVYYLRGLDGDSVRSHCTYTFATDGTVKQVLF